MGENAQDFAVQPEDTTIIVSSYVYILDILESSLVICTFQVYKDGRVLLKYQFQQYALRCVHV